MRGMLAQRRVIVPRSTRSRGARGRFRASRRRTRRGSR
jgi:hypothetical protein